MNICEKAYSWIAESPSTRDPFFIFYNFYKKGVNSINFDLNKRYDNFFYMEHIKLKPAYSKLADLIYKWANPSSALDIGCGNAHILYYLSQRGVEVLGVDGSRNALNFVDDSIKDKILIRDLTMPQEIGKFDVVISTEVAEHIPKGFSDIFVSNIANNAGKYVVFSAAKPGQWGDGHINCQPRKFWIKLFRGRGFSYDCEASEWFNECVKSSPEIMETLPWPWLEDNFMLFIIDSYRIIMPARTQLFKRL